MEGHHGGENSTPPSRAGPMWRHGRDRNDGARLYLGIPGIESPSHWPGYPSVEEQVGTDL